MHRLSNAQAQYKGDRFLKRESTVRVCANNVCVDILDADTDVDRPRRKQNASACAPTFGGHIAMEVIALMKTFVDYQGLKYNCPLRLSDHWSDKCLRWRAARTITQLDGKNATLLFR